MPTREQLTEYARGLSLAELTRRLRGGELTELGTEVTRHELVARGIDVERALSEPLAQASPPAVPQTPSRPRRILRRVLRFPFRAILGVEPLWVVVLFGGGLVFIIYSLISWAIGQSALLLYPILFPVHMHYLLLIVYVALGIRALTATWWGVALWRTGGVAKVLAWTILARIAAVICGINAIFGNLDAARRVQEIVVGLVGH